MKTLSIMTIIVFLIISSMYHTAVGQYPMGQIQHPVASILNQTMNYGPKFNNSDNPQAKNSSTIQIESIQINPMIIHVGDKFTVTATFANNSPTPTYVTLSPCGEPFTVKFDTHVKIEYVTNLTCPLFAISQKIEPSETMEKTSPSAPITPGGKPSTYVKETVIYKAVASGIANGIVTFPYSIWDQANQSNISKTISKSFQFTISDQLVLKSGNVYGPGGPAVRIILDPLQQFKSGISTNDVKCKEGLHLMIKSEDSSPACVETKDAVHLFERGWTKQIHYYIDKQISHDVYSYVQPKVTLPDYSYDGIDKDGVVTIKNETYYQTTFNYTIDNLPKDVHVKFQNVTFIFPDGILNTPGGSFVPLEVKFQDVSEEVYGGTVVFSDGVTGLAGISIPTMYGPSIAKNSIIVLGNHLGPQAGLAIYQDKIKLLVSK